MQTLYIDVYFLINLCVDALALYFAIRFTKAKGSIVRLLLSSTLLSLGTCFYTVFLSGSIWGYLLLLAIFFLSIIVCAREMNGGRFLKLSLFFLLFSFLIGGVVQCLYNMLEYIVKNGKIDINNGAENRTYLIFSVFILISIGVIRLFTLLYESTKHMDCVTISFVLFDQKHSLCALVDSGNLLCDPLTRAPVVVVKKDALRLPFSLSEESIETMEFRYKKQLRLVPARSLGYEKILYGFYIEHSTLSIGKREREVGLTIAIDPEGGTYGGYRALAPSAILDYDT